MHANEASNGLCDDAVDIAIRLPIMCYGGGVAELWIGGWFRFGFGFGFWLWFLDSSCLHVEVFGLSRCIHSCLRPKYHGHNEGQTYKMNITLMSVHRPCTDRQDTILRKYGGRVS